MKKITEVAIKLRTARRLTGLTRRELAEKLGINPIYIAKYELGWAMPPAITYLRIIECLKKNKKKWEEVF